MSCEKDQPSSYEEQALEKCIASSAANNPKTPGAEYAQFELNGRKIVLSDGYDGYQQFNNIAMTFTTSGPVLDPSTDSSRQYLLKIGFDQPSPTFSHGSYYDPTSDQIYISLEKKENLSVVEFIDNYIHVGDLQLKRKRWWDTKTDPAYEEGFEISYWCAHCCEDNGSTVYVNAYRSSSPDQKGFLRCTKLERVDWGQSVGYHIEFEFMCELYKPGYVDFELMPSYYIYVATIKEGKMVVDFVVEK